MYVVKFLLQGEHLVRDVFPKKVLELTTLLEVRFLIRMLDMKKLSDSLYGAF